MKCPKLSFKKYSHLIQDADVLLFRSSGGIHSVGWWIRKYTFSNYSHVGLAHWQSSDNLMCLEFREFKGSREYPIEKYLTEGQYIDIFRACTLVKIPYMDYSDPDNLKISTCPLEFTNDIANNIIKTAHKLIGKKYSWWTIWQLAKIYMPVIRLCQKTHKNGEIDPKKFVCSTLVTYAYRQNYLDPVPNLPDSYTTPGDLARSELFVKLFEIIP